MKKYRPTTPSRRHMTTSSYKKVVTTDKAEKTLTTGFRRGSGRNHHGRITTRHRGGGHKRRYRLIDFNGTDKLNIPATIESIQYDPNRSAYIALALYADGERRYVLACESFQVGSTIITSENEVEVDPGNRTMLKNIPLGTRIYNIETKEGAGAKLVRSAGTGAELTARDAGYAQIKLPSGEIRRVREECYATIGEVSNSEHKLRTIGKAGRKRHMGWRPTVRGTAMNPVDHPMGGGEAKSRGQRKHKKTKWGKVVDPGVKTRRPGKYSDHLIVSRRKTKKRK